VVRPPRFDPARYPGERPGGPVLVTDEGQVPVGVAAAVERTDLRWLVAYGANASPDRLRDKGLTGPGALLLPARLHGWVAAFEARLTGYGAVPLTLVPQPGVRTDAWVLGVHRDLVGVLDRTEGRVPDGCPDRVDPDAGSPRHAPPGSYQLGRVGPVRVAGGWVLPDGLAYLPGPSTAVQRCDDGWRTWPAHDQAAAGRHLAGDGPSAPAPRPRAPVLGPWPMTPLVREETWRGGQSGRSIAGWRRAAAPRR
jgi:hypothetical protein